MIQSTVNVLKFRPLFSFSFQMLVIRAGNHNLLVRTANRKTLNRLLHQKQSGLGMHCLSTPLRQEASVQNFRTFSLSYVCGHSLKGTFHKFYIE